MAVLPDVVKTQKSSLLPPGIGFADGTRAYIADLYDKASGGFWCQSLVKGDLAKLITLSFS